MQRMQRIMNWISYELTWLTLTLVFLNLIFNMAMMASAHAAEPDSSSGTYAGFLIPVLMLVGVFIAADLIYRNSPDLRQVIIEYRERMAKKYDAVFNSRRFDDSKLTLDLAKATYWSAFHKANVKLLSSSNLFAFAMVILILADPITKIFVYLCFLLYYGVSSNVSWREAPEIHEIKKETDE